MGASGAKTAVIEDRRFQDHRGPDGHPERPERLDAVHEAIEGHADHLDALSPREASAEEILRVHRRQHWEFVEQAARRAPTGFDADTYASQDSFDVAKLAAGSSIEIARRVARGEVRSGLAAVRPPGHHAESDRAMGFCLFNNVAIAARAVQAEDGVERVMIFDWDVHHGNGTQHFFEEDPNVLYASTHQFPYYPGTGAAGETGRGPGEGATLNIPLTAGAGDEEYLGAIQHLLVPAARAFRPELILVSCGFDAHADDPLAAMEVSGDGFSAMATILRALAEDLCGGKLALVLEGGYALSGLREGTDRVLDAISRPTPHDVPPEAEIVPNSHLDQVLTQVSQAHAGHLLKKT
jgi:acetoin utilization deacetylase AcuC-like enzyme